MSIYWDHYEKLIELLGKSITWEEFKKGIDLCEKNKINDANNARFWAVYIDDNKIDFSTRQILKMVYLNIKNGNEQNWNDHFDTVATRDYILECVTDFKNYAELREINESKSDANKLELYQVIAVVMFKTNKDGEYNQKDIKKIEIYNDYAEKHDSRINILSHFQNHEDIFENTGKNRYKLTQEGIIKAQEWYGMFYDMVSKGGNDMLQNNLNDEEFNVKIKSFLDRCIEAEHGNKSVSQSTKEYDKMYYKNYEISVSFGHGAVPATFWFSFLKYGQEVRKGIYPVLLYNLYTGHGKNKKEVLEDNLEICYGVSADEKSNVSWPEYITNKYHSSKSNNYEASYAKNVYTINDETDIDSNIKSIINDINQILLETTQLFEKDRKGFEGSGSENDGTPKNIIPKNQILYGPPGTGKTYNTIVKAMSIIDGIEYEYSIENDGYYDKKDTSKTIVKTYEDLRKEFNDYKKEENGKRIEFITFHQSYSYEEFVEGIKPYIPKSVWDAKNIDDIEKLEVKYIGKKGIFREICDRANSFEELYKLFMETYSEGRELTTVDKQESFIITKYLDDGFEINKGSDKKIRFDKLQDLYNNHQDTPYTDRKSVEKDCTNKPSYYYPILLELDKLKKPYVLIIDEINRGNISKIFGELITLIEEDKRAGEPNAIKVTLPYSGDPFSVPKNLYIIGTMNTADRSIAMLDTALRRRFDFEEMPPKPELLTYKENGEEKHKKVKFGDMEVDLYNVLTNLNDNIINKGLDKDHKIGHAFFINVKSEEELKRAFLNKIYPLLEEYFYGENKNIAEVLGGIDEKDLDKIYNPKENILGKILENLSKEPKEKGQ